MNPNVAKYSVQTLRAVIFDVDGTLLDSNDQHTHAFVDAFLAYGERVPYETIRPLIGMGSDKLIPKALGRKVSEAEEKKIGDIKKRIFFDQYLSTIKAFPKVRELLEDLRARGLRLAIATSAGGDELKKLLKAGGIDGYFDEAASSQDAEESKPDPDIVQAAIDRLRLPKHELLMIGDTPYDITAATRAGIPVLAVRCGGWDDRHLAGAVGIVNDAAALLGEWGRFLPGKAA